jgi:hypothetical protein
MKRWDELIAAIFGSIGSKGDSHRHVFDSENGLERYGTLVVLKCECSVGRVFSQGGHQCN